MQCRYCGRTNDEQSAFCLGCGSALGNQAEPAAAPVPAPAPPQAAPVLPVAAVTVVKYAGFWKRFVASIIDNMLLWVASYAVLMVAMFATVGANDMIRLSEAEDPAALMNDPVLGTFAVIVLAWMVFVFLSNWLYSALMESSGLQATVGKLALGIVVTDSLGKRISFGRASARFWSKIISGLILFAGYIMAGFTSKKQALHDIIVDTLVVVKTK